MGKVVERRKKKKKGRPSLIDIQKRSIQEHQQPNPNPNSKTTPYRRPTRRNPDPDLISRAADENGDSSGEDDDELNGNRRQKKLNLVLKLPSNSAPLNSGSSGADPNAEDDSVGANHKKQKLNAGRDGVCHGDSEKAESHISAPKSTTIPSQGTQLDMGPNTPLPDKKLLLFILDRLQKKDTYGVFAEPVDPEELPDYHEIVEHPMDFGTVRKNLDSGVYGDLEQFEKDVILICSNAMQYNAPDTIYFRQARSIQDLAKKDFGNLRQESDDNEPERKIVRRGRPPTKYLKKHMGRPSLERLGSEFSSDVLATGAENTTWSNYDTRKGPLSDKPGPTDFSGRSLYGSRNSETNSGWLAEQKSEKNDDFTGSMSKGNWMKHGKKQLVFDESRRNTYKQSHLSSGGREPSVLTTFDGERKHLMAVGPRTGYGYARSLAYFTANLGHVAWKVASKKIEKSLPAGVKFGPGWVGEIEGEPLKSMLFPSTPAVHPSLLHPLSLPGNSHGAATPNTLEIKGEKSSDISEGKKSLDKITASTHSTLDDKLHKSRLSSGSTSSSIIGNRFPEPTTESSVNVRPGMNGFNGAHGLNLSAQMGKLIGSIRATGINPRSSQTAGDNCLNTEESKLLENQSKINSVSRMGLKPQPYWQQVPLQQKPGPVQPDLNVKFQSPGSPKSTPPDLALQL